jgi:hypothetical protein
MSVLDADVKTVVEGLDQERYYVRKEDDRGNGGV